MKPILLIPIIAGMVLVPSPGSVVDAPKPRSPVELYTRSYSRQMQDVRRAPTAAEVRASEYAQKTSRFDEHHEVMQTSGHSGVVGPGVGRML